MAVDLTAQIHQYLASAPGSLFVQRQVEITDHWEGDANLLWRVMVDGNRKEQAVVKLFLDAGQARSRRQFDGQQLFSELGLAPKPLWVDRYPHGLARQVLVYSWIEGEHLSTDAPYELVAWAEAIGNLHNTPPDEVRRFSPHPVNLDYYWRVEQGSIAQVEKWLAASGLAIVPIFQKLTTATAQLVEASLPLWATALPTPVHGDLSLAHTLLARGRVILLDWEMFGLGDPALDVARLLQRESHSLSPDQVETWLDSYHAVLDQPQIVTRIDIFRRLLDAHNVIYLLVGLQQNTTVDLNPELRAAFPFIRSTLQAAIERAAVALELHRIDSIASSVADFFVWLGDRASATS